MKKIALVLGSLIILTILSQDVFGQEQLCRFSEPIDLEYLFDDGTIRAICLTANAFAIEVFLTTEEDGVLTMTIPRNVLDVRNPDCTDKTFMVLGDKGDPKVFETNTTADSRTIEIHYNSQEVREFLIITTDIGIAKPYKLGSECPPMDTKNLPPLKQVKNGVPVDEVICKESLELIFKSTDGSPACVKPETVERLIERGWGTTTFLTIQKTWVGRVDTQCNDPWDGGNISKFAQDYIQNHPEYNSRNSTHLLNFLSYAIPKYYEEKGITIYDIKLKRNAVPSDLCEGCGCNAGGHAWYLLVSAKDVDKLKEWYKVLAEEINSTSTALPRSDGSIKKHISLTTDKSEYSVGEPVTVMLKNPIDVVIPFDSSCFETILYSKDGNTTSYGCLATAKMLMPHSEFNSTITDLTSGEYFVRINYVIDGVDYYSISETFSIQ